MKLRHSSWSILVVFVLLDVSCALLLPKRMRIGNCGPCVKDCIPAIEDEDAASNETTTVSDVTTTSSSVTTTTTSSSQSVNEQAQAAVRDTSTQLTGLVTDAQSRRKRSLNAHSREERDTSNEISVTIIIQFKVKIQSWLVDINRLTSSDIPDIKNTTSQIINIRSQVAGGMTLSAKSIAIVKASVTMTAKLLGDLSSAIADEYKQKQLDSYQISMQQVQTTVETVQTTLVSLQSITSTTVSSNTMQLSIVTIIIEIKVIIIIIIRELSSSSSFSSSSLTQLSTYSSQLQSLSSQVTEMSSEHSETIQQTLTQVEVASSTVSMALARSQESESSFKELAILKELYRATSVFKESVSLIVAAQKRAESFSNTTTYRISVTIIDAFNDLLESLDSVSQDTITAIKSFENETAVIINLLSTQKVQIQGFDLLISLNKRLEKSVLYTLELSTSRTSIIERTTIISSVNFYITYIIQIIYDIQNATTSSSTQSVSSITTITTFLSSLDMSQLSQSDVTTLQTYSTTMNTILESMETNGNTITGIDTLLSTAQTTSQSVNSLLITAQASEERVVVIERTETVVKLIETIQTEVSVLISKQVSTGGVTGSGSAMQSIESTISILITYMEQFSSQTYVISAEDIVIVQQHLEIFISLVNQVTTFTRIVGLSEFVFVLQTASTVMVSREESLSEAFETKQQLETFSYMSSFLVNVQTLLSTLVESSSSSSSGNLYITDIQTIIIQWTQGVQYIQRSAIDDAQGFYLSLKESVSSGDSVSGKDTLLTHISTLEMKIEEAVNATREADAQSESRYNQEEAFGLISDSLSSLQLLLELTSSVGGAAVSNDQVTVISKIITQIRMKTIEINAVFIEEFRTALISLNHFISTVQTSGQVQRVSGLEEVIATTVSVRKSVKVSLTQVQTNRVEIFNSVQQLIISTITLLQSAVVNETAVDVSTLDTIETEAIDEFFSYMIMLQEGTISITQEFVEILQVLMVDIQQIISSANSYTLITGYEYTITQTITIATLIQTELVVMITEEQNVAQSNAAFLQSKNLVSNVREIVLTLEYISANGVASNNDSYLQTFQSFNTTLMELSSSVTNFASYTQIQLILTTLLEIRESNSKPNGIDGLLTVAISTIQVVEVYVTSLTTEFRALESIRQMREISRATNTMARDMSMFITGLQPAQLVGENDEDIEKLIIYLNSIAANVDLITEEVLTYISSQVTVIINIVRDLEPGQGIGNIVALRSAITRLMTSSETRRREQEDRELVKMEVAQVESSIQIVQQIYMELSTKIDIITSSRMTVTDNTNSVAMSNVTTIMRMISQGSISEISVSELNASLSIIQNIQVTPGTEIEGIFELQSLAEQSVSTSESARQFLLSTQQSRRNIDIMSSSTQMLVEIQIFLEQRMVQARGSQTGSMGGASALYVDLQAMMMRIVRKEELTFTFLEDLEFLMDDLMISNEQVSYSAIANILEITRTASSITRTSLSEEKRVSAARQETVLLKKSSSVVLEVREILLSFKSASVTSGTAYENENITMLIQILNDISTSKIVSEERVSMLERYIEIINTIDVSVFSGQMIVGLREALTSVEIIHQTIVTEIEYTSKAMTRSVVKGIKNKAMTALQRITSSATRLISSTSVGSSVVSNPTVSDIIVLLRNISIETLTVDEANLLVQKATELESITVDSNTGIAGLRDLKSVAIAHNEAIERSDKVLSTINRVSQTKIVFGRAQTALASLRTELSNISFSADESEESSMISDIFILLSSDMAALSEHEVMIYEDIVENLKVVKSTIKITSTRMQTLVSTILVSERQITTHITKFVTKESKLQQTQTFTEMQSLLKSVSEVTVQIVSTNGMESSSSEGNDVVDNMLVLMRQFKSSVIDITEEHVQVIRTGMVELQRILNRGSIVRGISQLSTMSTSIVEIVTRESSMLERETRREERRDLKIKQERTVNFARSVMESFAQRTVEVQVDIEYVEEIEILEVSRAFSILILVQRGTATESDIEQLQTYTETLESIIETHGSGVIVKDLNEAIEMTATLSRSLETTIIEDSFDLSYSESVYEQKQMKSVLSETATFLETLASTNDNGTEESFTSYIFEEIMQSTSRLESRSYRASYEALQSNLEILRSETQNISTNTRITGLENVIRTTRSAVVTVESSISRSYTIEYASEEVTTLRETRTLLSNFEFVITKLFQKGGQATSGSSTQVEEMNEILMFIQTVRVYTSREIVILREYIELFTRLYREISDSRIEGIESLSLSVSERKVFIERALSIKSQVQRSEKQVLYTSAASSKVQTAYQRVTSVEREYILSEVKEVREITKFSMFLRSIDMSSINAVGISKLSHEMDIFSAAMATEQSGSIAYLSSISEQLVQFTYAAERHLTMKTTFERDYKVSTALKESRGAIHSLSNQLQSYRLDASSQDNANYEESSIVTTLYNFLITYTFDFRLITEDFVQQLTAFNLSSISVSSGGGITYLDEVLSLTNQFMRAEREASESVKTAESIMKTKELQSSISLFTKAIEQFIYAVEDTSDSEVSGGPISNVSTTVMGNDTDATSPASETEGSSEQGSLPSTMEPLGSTDNASFSDGTYSTASTHEDFTFSGSESDNLTTENAASTEDLPDNIEFEEEIEDPFEIFDRIQENLERMSSESFDFKEHTSQETTELIAKFMQTDFTFVFGWFGKSYLRRSLVVTNRISVRVSSRVQTLESSSQVEKSFTMLEETSAVLQSVEESYTRIISTQRGSSRTVIILSSIESILRTFTNIYFVSSEDIALLRSYSYELRVASTSNESISLNATDFSSLITSSMTMVKSASYSQSSLLTTARVSSSTSFASSMSQTSTFTSFSSRASRDEVVYNREESRTIQEISQVTQQVYVMEQFSELLEVTTQSLQELASSSNEATTAASSQATSTTGSTDIDGGLEESDESEESESVTLLSQISQLIRISTSNMQSLQIDTLTKLASYVRKIKTFINATETIDVTIIQKTLSSVTTLKQTFNETMVRISSYAQESQGFLNLQEASLSLEKLSEGLWMFESSAEEANNAVMDITVSGHIDIVTRSILQFSMRRSAISEISLREFKESFSYIVNVAKSESIFIHDFSIWKRFLLDVQQASSESMSGVANKGAIMRSQTQREVYVTEQAMSVVESYLVILNNFSIALNGDEESQSISRGRLEQIISEFSETSDSWGTGRIEISEVTKYESYLHELSELLILLSGSALPAQVTHLTYKLTYTKEILVETQQRLSVEVIQDREDAEIDSKYEYYSQLSSFLQSSVYSDEHASGMEDVTPEYNTTGNGNTSLASTSGASTPSSGSMAQDSTTASAQDGTTTNNSTQQNGTQGGAVRELLAIYEEDFANPTVINIMEVEYMFTSLIFEIQQNPSLLQDQLFMNLVVIVNDASAYVKASRQGMIYSRAASVVYDIGTLIPFDIRSTMHEQGYLVFNQEVLEFQQEIRTMQTQLTSVSRSTIRSFSRSASRVQKVLETHSSNILYLMNVDEMLSLMYSSATKHAKYTLQQYSYSRASSIFSEASVDIEYALDSLKIMTVSSESASDYVENDVVNGAFYFLVNFTSDYTLIPRNLGRLIQEYNFGSINVTEGSGIYRLEAVHHMLKKLKEAHERASVGTAYMERRTSSLRMREMMRIIIQRLKVFSSYLDDLDDDDLGNSTTYGETNTTESSVTESDGTTMASTNNSTVNASEGDYNGTDEKPMSIDDVMMNIMNITDYLIMNGLTLEMEQMDELEYYSKIMNDISLDMGRDITGLIYILERLSYAEYALEMASHAYDSAFQVVESSTMIKEIREMNKLIQESMEVITSEGTRKSMTLVEYLQDFYTYFARGFNFITQVDIDSCWEFVYELSNINGTGESTSGNSSNLLSLIQDVESRVIEVEGILSAYSYHYESLLNHDSDVEKMMSAFELSSSSERSYILYEINALLDDLYDVVSLLEPEQSSNNSDSTSSEDLFEVSSAIKAVNGDLQSLQFSVLYTLSQSLLRFELNNKTTLNETYINEFSEFLFDQQNYFRMTEQTFGNYGRASTQVLILQDAVGMVEHITEATHKWIYGRTADANHTGGNGSDSNQTTTTSVSGSSVTTTTSAPSTTPAPTTTLSPTTIGQTSTPGNLTNANVSFSNASALQDSESFQDHFEMASDILMYWTFDSSAVSGEYVTILKSFMAKLELSCQTVLGLHMWEQVLLLANVTLSSVMQDIYLKHTLERAILEETLLRFTSASDALDGYIQILGDEDFAMEDYSASEDNSTALPFNETSDGSTSYMPMESSSNSSDDGLSLPATFSSYGTNETTEGFSDYSDTPMQSGNNVTEEDAMAMRKKIKHLITLSHHILRRWNMDLDVRQYETRDLYSHSSELSDLLYAGGLLEGNVDGLRRSVLDSHNETSNALMLLQDYYDESFIWRGHVLTTSFFEQLQQLVEYATDVLKGIESNGQNQTNGNTTSGSNSTLGNAATPSGSSGGSQGTTPSGTNANVTSSSPGDNSTGNSSMESEYQASPDCYDDLLCAAQQLLMALQELPVYMDDDNSTSNSTDISSNSTDISLNYTGSSLSSTPSSGDSSGDNGTTVGGLTESSMNDTSDANSTTVTDSGMEPQEERPSFMDHYSFEFFFYEDLRMKVYQFSTALRRLSKETFTAYGEVIDALETAEPIIESKLNELRNADLHPRVNVTMYIRRSEEM